jgi:hypothetical protein
MAKYSIRNINTGGIADGPYNGLENSLFEIVGMDIHSVPGLLQVNQKLKLDSGSVIDDFCKAIVPCSDGNVYFFGYNTGKIWKKDSVGTYSLVATNANGAILNAKEYQGYIYYFTPTKIGRWKLGTAWTSRTDTWNTFAKGNTLEHPAIVLNIVLYVGDENLISSIREYDRVSCDLSGSSATRLAIPKPQEGMYYFDTDTSTVWNYTLAAGWANTGSATYTVFKTDALDFESKFKSSALGVLKYQLVAGSRVTNESICKVFRWDTWSISFTSEDEVPVKGINCFIATDNYVLASAGEKGDLYTYDGEQAVAVKKIPGNFGVGKSITINPNASVNFLGDPLIGVSNKSGNPSKQGVYSFTSYSSAYPIVLNLDYPISNGEVENVEIGAIANAGDNILVSWKYTDPNTHIISYGVDTIDANNKVEEAYLITRKFMVDRTSPTNHGFISIGYNDMPANCDVEVWISVNGEAYRKLDTVKDEIRKILKTKVAVGPGTSVDFKFVPIVDGNNAPKIEIIDIYY